MLNWRGKLLRKFMYMCLGILCYLILLLGQSNQEINWLFKEWLALHRKNCIRTWLIAICSVNKKSYDSSWASPKLRFIGLQNYSFLLWWVIILRFARTLTSTSVCHCMILVWGYFSAHLLCVILRYSNYHVFLWSKQKKLLQFCCVDIQNYLSMEMFSFCYIFGERSMEDVPVKLLHCVDI